MAFNVFRILNSTVYTLLAIVLFCLTLLTPGDFIYQCYRTRKLTNIFIVTGVYILTVLLALLVYASRIYTIRTGLGSIPKAWIPVAKGEVGESVHRLVEDGLKRSAIVAYQARPRNLSDELNEPAHDEELSIKVDHPPWGPVLHAGWSSPSSLDLPGLRYQRVIEELPHLIEAKAVSLAPPDTLLSSNRFVDPSEAEDYNIPDPRVVEILQRPASMGLRDYVGHLTNLDLIDPPELGAEFLSIYEQARFSPTPLVEDEFRTLMGIFAKILRGMKAVDPKILQEIRGDDSQGDSESFIGPSDEEGETDTLGTEEMGGSLHRGQSNNSSPWSSSIRSVRTAPMVQSRGSPALPRSNEGLRDGLRASPSMRSLRRTGSNISQNSAGSVIRLVKTRSPDDLPYAINIPDRRDTGAW